MGMRNRYYIFRLSLLFCVLLPLVGFAQKKLTIYHTNDLHSRIEPVDVNFADTMSAGKGGMTRIAACVKQMREEGQDFLLFDSGDFSQGSPYYNLFKGEVEVKLMNAMGYAAATIGNHEFDFGLDNMARLFRMAGFPIVCANYDVRGTVLEGLVKPYIILKKKGLKIGVFGLGTRLNGMVQADNCKGVVYSEPYDIANEVAALLKKKGCDVVICLSHLGFRPSAKDTVCDINLIQQTRNIDLVLGGHSHTYMKKPESYRNLDGKEVPVTQMGTRGIYLGCVNLLFD